MGIRPVRGKLAEQAGWPRLNGLAPLTNFAAGTLCRCLDREIR
jgi:hypothetical protein